MSIQSMSVEHIAKRVNDIHEAVAKHLPNVVHCPHCGTIEAVNAAECLRAGWPKCCSSTMLLGYLGPVQ